LLADVALGLLALWDVALDAFLAIFLNIITNDLQTCIYNQSIFNTKFDWLN